MTISVTTQLLAATCWSSNRIDLVAIGGDSQMYHSSWDPSYGWQSSWDGLGGSFAAVAPTVVSWSSKRLDVFGLDKDSSTLQHKAWSGSWDASWGSLGEQTFRGPFAVDAWSQNRLDVFGVGKDDGAMYHQSVCILSNHKAHLALTDISSVVWELAG